MAIRIDLLPRYVALRRWFKRISAICVMLVGTFAAILGLIYYRDHLRLTKLKTDRENIKVFADKTDIAEAAAKSAEAEAQPMQSTVNFFVDAGRTGSERAALLDLIRRSVYNGAYIGTLDISDGKKVVFSGMIRTPDDYARFLLKLRQNAAPTGILFANLPVGSAISGWPNKSGASGNTTGGQPGGAPVGRPVGAPGTPGLPGGPGQTQTGAATSDEALYYVFDNKVDATAELRNPIVIPAVPGAAVAAPGAGGPGAMPGMPPGAPGAGPPGAPPGAPPKAP